MKFRPRFSLRTLFVLIAIIGVGLGFLERERRIVTQRRQLIDEIENGYPRSPFHVDGYDPETDEPTWLRKQFGDRNYDLIILPESASDDLVRRTKYLFPNAYQKRAGTFHKLN